LILQWLVRRAKLKKIQFNTPNVDSKELNGVKKVLKSNILTQGSEVNSFENSFKKFLGVDDAIAVNSGTSALVLSLLGLGIGPGDEVIVPDFTFGATANAVILAGARPVLADVDVKTFNLSLENLITRVTPKTKAIIFVHLFGNPSNLTEILNWAREKQIFLIEDAAQALGATINGANVGSLGDVSCFSFYPTKTITCGEGGLVATSNPKVAENMRVLRNQGTKRQYEYEVPGYNFRMSEINAVIGNAQLEKLDRFLAARRAVASVYIDRIANVIHPVKEIGVEHCFNQFTIRVDSTLRDRLMQELEAKGIPSKIYYPSPLSKFKIFESGSINVNAQRASGEVLSLPIHTKMSMKEVKFVAKSVNETYEEMLSTKK
jgi:perosamine synthetase